MARAVGSAPELAPVRDSEQVRVPVPAPAWGQEPALALETELETVWPRGRSGRVLRFHNWIRRMTQSRGILRIGKFVER